MKLGPPTAKVFLMWNDHGVMRFLRSAGPLTFGPASQGVSGGHLRFTFHQHLDPGFTPDADIYPVIWRRYDNGELFQQIALAPILMSGRILDGWDVVLDLNVTLDRRSWLTQTV